MAKRSFGTVARKTSRATNKTTGYLARYTGPDAAKHSRTFTARIDAEAWLWSEEALTARGTWSPPKTRRVPHAVSTEVFAAQVLARRSLAPRTREEYTRYLERFVEGTHFGRSAIEAVEPADVANWWSWSSDETGPTMAGRVYSFIGSVFAQAVRERLGRVS